MMGCGSRGSLSWASELGLASRWYHCRSGCASAKLHHCWQVLFGQVFDVGTLHIAAKGALKAWVAGRRASLATANSQSQVHSTPSQPSAISLPPLPRSSHTNECIVRGVELNQDNQETSC